MSSKIICTVNNHEIFEKVVKNNQNLKNCEIVSYDNTKENVSITKRYNDFIKNHILGEYSGKSGFWCAFIHQDFGFMEDIDLALEKLDKDYIYGATGIRILKGAFFGKKHVKKEEGFEQEVGFKKELKLPLGKILQGNNDFNFFDYGFAVKTPQIVDVIDCCCIIIHSDLIKKYNLNFDENLDFHLYAEEICYRAKKDYGIKTKVVQINCFHLGRGNLGEEFQKSAQYLKEKFHIKIIPSTCPN